MRKLERLQQAGKLWLVAGALAVLGIFPTATLAQNPHAQQAASQASDNQALADQIQQLREQVSRLQQTIQQQSAQKKSGTSPAPGMQMGAKKNPPGMSMQDDMGEMGMKAGAMPMGDMGEMSGMSGGKPGMGMEGMGMGAMKGGMSMMDDMDEMGSTKQSQDPAMTGMAAMGTMKAAPKMAMQSALPGFPGASHLYHIGSTGFFLDHPKHITLTNEQRTRLSQIQQKALLEKATAQRKVDEAEQQLFTLTGADQPNQANIEAKIQEIAGLRAQQRLAYIRTVGEASQVLTVEQQRQLVGQAGKMASK